MGHRTGPSPELAERLEDCCRRDVKVLGFEFDERETIIRALDDAPPGQEELRAVLLQEQVGRLEQGLQ